MWTNTIDAGRPASTVRSLPTVTETVSFVVSFSSNDDADGKPGSGVDAYDLYVSDNGGPFTLWRAKIKQDSIVYTGQDGHRYQFYTIASDAVGHTELAPLTFDAQTRIVTKLDRTPPTVRFVPVDPSPRFAPVQQISIAFSEPVTGFDLSDLSFTRFFAEPVALLPGNARLSTTDNRTWTLSNLEPLTIDSGVYRLEVDFANAAIVDFAGNLLAAGGGVTWSMRPGDANNDHTFNTSDLVLVFQRGEYEDAIVGNSTWADGDWTGDREFTSSDLVAVFQSGGYVQTAVADRNVRVKRSISRRHAIR